MECTTDSTKRLNEEPLGLVAATRVEVFKSMVRGYFVPTVPRTTAVSARATYLGYIPSRAESVLSKALVI
jgi:hypothetical protein